ncbi:MAG TPA: cytochrome C oxidase subunit IV family protein [Polyangia bacterium]|nr:cytochrome C oxidase subunit IV family protein [Polyangia bacterium]
MSTFVETPKKTRRLVLALALLLALTALELGIANLPVPRNARVTALVGLAMTKALVLLAAFMGIGREPRIVRFAALVPIIAGPGFAVVLMLEAAFRAVTWR